MKDPLANIEIIESYHEGLLNESERKRIEILLQTDPIFKDEYELYIKLVEGIKSTAEVNIRTQLRIIEFQRELKNTNPSTPTDKSKTNSPKKYFWAAAAIIIFIFCFSIITYNNTFSKKAIVKKYYVEELGLPVLMGENKNLQLDKVMNYYKTAYFPEAYKLINEIYKNDSANDTLLYFSGVLSLKMNNAKNAENFFNKGIQQGNSVFHEDFEYRFAVSHFLLENENEAKKIFLKIYNETQNPYSQSASQFLKQIN